MLYYTSGQWKIFLAMIPAGFAAGVWYGVVSIFREVMRSGPVLRTVCDVIAAAGIWLCVVAGLLITCYGDIRLFALLAASAGFTLERLTLGMVPRMVVSLYKKISKVLPFRQEKAVGAAK